MYYSSRKWLGALAAAALVALPVVAQAQDNQNYEDQSRQSDSQRDNSQNRNRNEKDRSRQYDDQSRQSDQSRRDQDRQREDRGRQQDRRWDDDSSNRQDDGPAGLGVTLDPNRSDRDGAVIQRVHRNSPAEQMGLREGDRITAVNGDDVESARDVVEEIRDLEPGEQVRIEIDREGDRRTLRGELESRREALVFRGQRQGQQQRGRFFDRRQRDDRWNQGQDRPAYYGDQSSRRQYSYEGGRTSNNQDIRQQLHAIERQVNQLSREIDDLRYALNSSAPSQRDYDRNRESQAGYDEYQTQDRFGSRTSYGQRTDGYQNQRDETGYDRIDSPGGEVGEERLRPESPDSWND